MTPEQLFKTFVPKVATAADELMDVGFHLHPIHDDRKDIFFSSLSAVFGLSRAAHYAASNAFIDGLSQTLHNFGGDVVSIRFGPFKDAGMASSTTWGSAFGLSSIRPCEIFNMISRYHSLHACPGVICAQIDVHKYALNYTSMLGCKEGSSRHWGLLDELLGRQIVRAKYQFSTDAKYAKNSNKTRSAASVVKRALK